MHRFVLQPSVLNVHRRIPIYPIALLLMTVLLNGCGESNSAPAELTAPQNVQAQAGNGKLVVSWSEVSGATGYNVYWGISAGIHPDTAASYDGVQIGVGSPHTITGLANGTVYYLVVTATAGSLESVPSIELSATPVTPILAIATGTLNDTGITLCGDASVNNLACPVAGFPGQDGEQGRDTTFNNITDGQAGFSFTKVSSNGTPLAVQTAIWSDNGSEAAGTKWSCVLDNVTGLLWEVKVNDTASIHNKNWTYSWYNSDPTTNGGYSGAQNAGSCIDNANCDTEKFVAAVNNRGLCGYSDWRLPSAEELMSLVDNSIAAPGPTIDTTFFPNTPNAWTWSSTLNVDPNIVPGQLGVWLVTFDRGHFADANTGFPYAARLVRSGP